MALVPDISSQLWHMEHIVHSSSDGGVPICRPLLLLAPISQTGLYTSDSASHVHQSDHSLGQRYPQKHMLSHLELQWSSIGICPTLLFVLCCTKVHWMVLILSTACTITSGPKCIHSPTSSQHNGDLHLLPYKASNGAILMLAWCYYYRKTLPNVVGLPTIPWSLSYKPSTCLLGSVWSV